MSTNLIEELIDVFDNQTNLSSTPESQSYESITSDTTDDTINNTQITQIENGETTKDTEHDPERMQMMQMMQALVMMRSLKQSEEKQATNTEQTNEEELDDLDMIRGLMLMRLLKEVEEEEEFEYIPKIQCSSTARNGTILVEISNVDDLIKNGKFDTYHDKCFQLIWRKSTDKEAMDNDLKWNARQIAVGNIGSGKFTLKLPLYLNEYHIEFGLRAINIKTDEWMTISPFKTVTIPSILIDTSYEFGDNVLFRDENEMYGSRATVVELLPDNKYKLAYFMYDASKGPRDSEIAWIECNAIIDKSRVFRLGIPQQQEIDLTDIHEMEKQILIKRDDEESVSVFNALFDFYKKQCLTHSVQMYGFKLSLIYWRSMTRFISKNIFDFLYSAMDDFEYKINCLVDPYNDGKLIMNHLREYAVRRYYDGLTINYDDCNLGKVSDVIEGFESDYQCDCCYSGINQFDYVYNCNAKQCNDTHDLCLNCVYTVIKLGRELQNWLNQLLQHILNNDCVHIIVDYVVGRAICLNYKEN